MRIKTTEKIIRFATIATLSFMIVWGFVVVVAQVKPFWVDEWRVIYNLKFKNAATIWGPLDFMQQFPRVYIEIVKAFTSLFDYSYLTLRLPSYIVGSFTIIFCYRLMNKIYGSQQFLRFLFVMILISCSTFTEYFVQVKQYTMDILLSLVAIWQLISLLELDTKAAFHKRRYLLLCASFLLVPFFSYTYPVAIAPAFIVVFLQCLFLLKSETINKQRLLFLKGLPLLLCTLSIAVFYVVDVAQLMHDKGMHQFWGHLMMDKGFDWHSFFLNFYSLFGQIGSGLVFGLLLGILGVVAFFFAIRSSSLDIYKGAPDNAALIRLYSVALLVLSITLFVAGKLPLGEPRLNAFTIPAISILVIHLLDTLKQRSKKGTFITALSVLLYVGVIGNIYTTFFASFTGPVYAKKMDTYRATENAIIIAQAQKIPIFITPGVAFPYDTTCNLPFQGTVPGDWVLKTFPAYKVAEHLPVYAITSMDKLNETIRKLPSTITSAIVGNGTSFSIIKR